MPPKQAPASAPAFPPMEIGGIAPGTVIHRQPRTTPEPPRPTSKPRKYTEAQIRTFSTSRVLQEATGKGRKGKGAKTRRAQGDKASDSDSTSDSDSDERSIGEGSGFDQPEAQNWWVPVESESERKQRHERFEAAKKIRLALPFSLCATSGKGGLKETSWFQYETLLACTPFADGPPLGRRVRSMSAEDRRGYSPQKLWLADLVTAWHLGFELYFKKVMTDSTVRPGLRYPLQIMREVVGKPLRAFVVRAVIEVLGRLDKMPYSKAKTWDRPTRFGDSKFAAIPTASAAWADLTAEDRGELALAIFGEQGVEREEDPAGPAFPNDEVAPAVKTIFSVDVWKPAAQSFARALKKINKADKIVRDLEKTNPADANDWPLPAVEKMNMALADIHSVFWAWDVSPMKAPMGPAEERWSTWSQRIGAVLQRAGYVVGTSGRAHGSRAMTSAGVNQGGIQTSFMREQVQRLAGTIATVSSQIAGIDTPLRDPSVVWGDTWGDEGLSSKPSPEIMALLGLDPAKQFPGLRLQRGVLPYTPAGKLADTPVGQSPNSAPVTLRQVQLVGIAALARKHFAATSFLPITTPWHSMALLADEVGLGKTMTTIAYNAFLASLVLRQRRFPRDDVETEVSQALCTALQNGANLGTFDDAIRGAITTAAQRIQSAAPGDSTWAPAAWPDFASEMAASTLVEIGILRQERPDLAAKDGADLATSPLWQAVAHAVFLRMTSPPLLRSRMRVDREADDGIKCSDWALACKPNIVVVPAHVSMQWLKEARAICEPGVTWTVYPSDKKERTIWWRANEHHLTGEHAMLVNVIVPISALLADFDSLGSIPQATAEENTGLGHARRKMTVRRERRDDCEDQTIFDLAWGHVAFDEAHLFRTGGQAGGAASQLSLRADFVTAVTATPIFNAPDDLVQLMHVCNAPVTRQIDWAILCSSGQKLQKQQRKIVADQKQVIDLHRRVELRKAREAEAAGGTAKGKEKANEEPDDDEEAATWDQILLEDAFDGLQEGATEVSAGEAKVTMGEWGATVAQSSAHIHSTLADLVTHKALNNLRPVSQDPSMIEAAVKWLSGLRDAVGNYVIRRTCQTKGPDGRAAISLPRLRQEVHLVSLTDAEVEVQRELFVKQRIKPDSSSNFMIENRKALVHAVYPKAGNVYPATIAEDETPSSKLRHLVDRVEQDLDADPTNLVAVYIYFTSMKGIVHRYFADRGIDLCFIDGSHAKSPETRPRLLEDVNTGRPFPADERPPGYDKQKAGEVKGMARVLVFSQVVASGVNLPAFNRLYLLDCPWSEFDIRQIIGRVHRQPQKREVHVARILAQMSVDTILSAYANNKMTMVKGLEEGRPTGEGETPTAKWFNHERELEAADPNETFAQTQRRVWDSLETDEASQQLGGTSQRTAYAEMFATVQEEIAAQEELVASVKEEMEAGATQRQAAREAQTFKRLVDLNIGCQLPKKAKETRAAKRSRREAARPACQDATVQFIGTIAALLEADAGVAADEGPASDGVVAPVVDEEFFDDLSYRAVSPAAEADDKDADADGESDDDVEVIAGPSPSSKKLFRAASQAVETSDEGSDGAQPSYSERRLAALRKASDDRQARAERAARRAARPVSEDLPDATPDDPIGRFTSTQAPSASPIEHFSTAPMTRQPDDAMDVDGSSDDRPATSKTQGCAPVRRAAGSKRKRPERSPASQLMTPDPSREGPGARAAPEASQGVRRLNEFMRAHSLEDEHRPAPSGVVGKGKRRDVGNEGSRPAPSSIAKAPAASPIQPEEAEAGPSNRPAKLRKLEQRAAEGSDEGARRRAAASLQATQQVMAGDRMRSMLADLKRAAAEKEQQRKE